ncbi:hypothetical protein INR49_031782, partial [Caranx melampygus]
MVKQLPSVKFLGETVPPFVFPPELKHPVLMPWLYREGGVKGGLEETINKEGISWTIAAWLAPCAPWELEEEERGREGRLEEDEEAEEGGIEQRVGDGGKKGKGEGGQRREQESERGTEK